MKSKFIDYFNLNTGEESKEKVLENVKSNISFRGSNLWILACAIVIASVGLNVNSTAVIIGAMLISPLMGPIVGAGFALAIYDFELLKRSVKNLLIATIVSLTVATLYFIISPFKDTQSELLARTSPNIYDVLIAFFGGLVGVIAMTRVEKGNPIPGVAIATALMPPLCTAGYGIAIGNYGFFMGAFFLYSINCVFICISTFLIIKYLKYEPVTIINSNYRKIIQYGITSLILIMIIPSCFLAYNLFQEKSFKQKVEQFISNEFLENGYTLIYKSTNYNTSPKEIKLAFLNKKFNSEELKFLNEKLVNYDISNTKLQINQNNSDLKSEILNEIGNQVKEVNEKDIIINNLQKEISEFNFDYSGTIKETLILFPELKNVSIGQTIINQNTDSVKKVKIVLFQKLNKKEKFDTTKIKKWLSQKLKTEDIKVIQEE